MGIDIDRSQQARQSVGAEFRTSWTAPISTAYRFVWVNDPDDYFRLSCAGKKVDREAGDVADLHAAGIAAGTWIKSEQPHSNRRQWNPCRRDVEVWPVMKHHRHDQKQARGSDLVDPP